MRAARGAYIRLPHAFFPLSKDSRFPTASPSRSETGDAMHPIRIGSSETLISNAGDTSAAPTGETADADVAESAADAALQQARTEQMMMRQDLSAATLLSPGKGQQGIPLHIPCPDLETPMGMEAYLPHFHRL